MPEKNKREKEKKENSSEKNEPEEKIEKEKAVWSEDQKNRRYYYDDAHGYEIYTPDDDD